MPDLLDHAHTSWPGASGAKPGGAARPRRDPCADERPCCPACGGLVCLCRPRFFPGQLLTDDDLNRLERYVVEKAKRHNRYLHGWGVACGLEVECDPCDARHVTVRSGFAVSPCGEEIAVCQDQSVDVCSLVQACRDPHEPVCDPPYQQRAQPCADTIERWVLAVCYDEHPTRGVTPLTGSGDSCCGPVCACGGSRSGGCGCGGGDRSGSCSCGGKGTAASAGTRTRKAFKPACEPTQVCEGYRWTAYRAPRPTPDIVVDPVPGQTSTNLLWPWLIANRTRFGPLIERVLCCVAKAMEVRATIREGRPLDRPAAVDVYVRYAKAMRTLATDFARHGCGFVSRVDFAYQGALDYADALAQPGGAARFDPQELRGRLVQLDATWLGVVAECLCAALLPPCPGPAKSDCVPLATLTVRVRDCRIVEICNWEERKLLIGWPTVSYWLSWLPWHRVRQWIAQICCEEDRDRSAYWLIELIFGVIATQLRAEAGAPGLKSDSLARATARLAGAPPAATALDDPVVRAMEADSLLGHVLQEFDRTRTGGDERTPTWAALAARAVDGAALASLARPLDAAGVDPRDLAAALGLDEVRNEINALKRTVEAQKRDIARLRKK